MKADEANHKEETLEDYKRIAKGIAENPIFLKKLYGFEDLPIVEKVNLLSMAGLTQACTIIAECRGTKFDADTWFAEYNPVYIDVACAVWQPWALSCCLAWEYITRLDACWDKKEFQDIYKNWPKNPNTMAFYIAGWSAVEVIHLFLTKIADIAGFTLRCQFTTLVKPNFAEKVDRGNIESVKKSVEKCEDSIGLGQYLSPEADCWFKTLKEAFKGHLPHSVWPDSVILSEYNHLVSQLEYECDQAIKLTKQQAIGNIRTQKKLHREADITAILDKDPTIKIAVLAKKLGVSKSTISRSKVWRQHKARPPREQFPDSHLPPKYE